MQWSRYACTSVVKDDDSGGSWVCILSPSFARSVTLGKLLTSLSPGASSIDEDNNAFENADNCS